MNLITIGDLHYDGTLSKLIPNQEQMINRSVLRILREAKAKGIRHVVLKGDIGDKPRLSYESQVAFLELLQTPGFMFHLMLGNHDLFSKDAAAGHSLQFLEPMLKLMPKVKLYTKPTTVKIEDAKVRFLPWPHDSTKAGVLNILHKEVQGASSDSGRLFNSKKLNDTDHVILSGHLHTAHRVRNTYYSGTPFQQNFGEKKRKYYHRVEYRSDDDYEVELVATKPEYELRTIVVESSKDLARIPSSDKVLVRLVVEDGADVDSSQWAGKTNVVAVTPFKTRKDLAAALAPTTGKSLQFSVDDHMRAYWINAGVADEQVEAALRTRDRLEGRT